MMTNHKQVVAGRARLVVLVGAFFLAVCLLGAPSALAQDEYIQPFAAKTFEGEDFSLEPYLGKVPIVLDFGSIYCSSCVQSIPHLIVLQNEYGEDRLKIVGVNLDTYGLGRVRRFFSTFSDSLNFPILIDKGLKVSKQFNVLTLPSYILIDKEGKIVRTIVGYDEEKREQLDKTIAELVEGKTITVETPTPEDDVVLMVPDNFTMTYQSKISVIGKTGGNPGPFTVRLNGGSEMEAIVKKGMFYARIPLSLGSNFIEARYPKGAGMGTLAVVMFREPRMGEGLQVNFPEYQFHTAEKEARCTECHYLVPEIDEEAGPMAMTDFCAGCHGYQTDVRFVHGPIPVGGCAACHDFQSEPHRYNLIAQGTELCFSCHADLQERFDRGNVHGPVVMGFCTVCHSPHGSSFQFQLRQTQSTLCQGCHVEMREKTSKFYPHEPVQSNNCTGCHDPHSSDSTEFFLKGEGAELCLLCHSESQMNGHTHPTNEVPEVVIEGLEMTEEGAYNCQTCHDPHSSDEEKLFTFAGGCTGCHEALKQAKKLAEEEDY